VVVYKRAKDGSLTQAGSYPTGGLGSGAGLGSQDAVIVSEDRRLLFAVNAGSNSISSFRLRDEALQLLGTTPSGGILPTSVTFRNGLLYVLNAGEPNNITGFRVTSRGRLIALQGSTRPLSAASTSPAQVGFSDDGESIIVTERTTNIIDTFAVDDEGRARGPFVHTSAGPTPFGFAVGRRNTVLVSEAGAGGGASTYRVDERHLDRITSMIMTGQRAACWAILTPSGHFGYVTNAGTGNISGFALARDGSAKLLNADGITAVTGGNPTDMAMSADGRYLYARVGALSQIAIFKIRRDGSLTPLRPFIGAPATLAGLAGF
jgi:6-phosphogluconolactonase